MSLLRAYLRGDRSRCPYYRRGGLCLTGCWSEPMCITREPANGWPLGRLRARGRKVPKTP